MKLETEFSVKIFSDGADRAGILEMYKNDWVKGFTTNPTLMRKAGITDYEKFARDILSRIADRPISFEVFSDDFGEMRLQALKIASWGDNVYVKIPVSNTKAQSSFDLVRELAQEGVKQNVTALMTLQQVEKMNLALSKGPSACISIFAGRIADTGRDPLPVMKTALEIISENKKIELIWASPRELLNIIQANEIGCHIITVTNDLLKKLFLIGKNLDEYSLETVKMFYSDAVNSKFTLNCFETVSGTGTK